MNFNEYAKNRYKEFQVSNLSSVRNISKKYKDGERTGNDIKEFIFKVSNFCDSWGFDFDDAVDEIISSDITAAKFSKDPKKQNLGEICQKDFLGIRGVVVEKLSAGGKNNLRLMDGEVIKGMKANQISDDRNATKSLDFIRGNDFIYAKWTEGDCGGAQDNQYNDVVHFLKEANRYIKKYDDGKRFIALLDGAIYKLENRREQILPLTNDRVIITDSDTYE